MLVNKFDEPVEEAMKKRAPGDDRPASVLIDEKIAALGDWRGETLARVRALIHEALPDVVEAWKWAVPVWERGGILCTGETYKAGVKMTFAHGARLDDPKGLFNASLDGGTRRAIDLHEGDTVNEAALKALIRAAAAFNADKAKGRATPASKAAKSAKSAKSAKGDAVKTTAR